MSLWEGGGGGTNDEIIWGEFQAEGKVLRSDCTWRVSRKIISTWLECRDQRRELWKGSQRHTRGPDQVESWEVVVRA